MPRPDDVVALREIAHLGALQGLVEVSTAQLATILGISQQTASRRVLDLERAGYLRREMGVRRQLVRLSEEGVNVLSREYASFQRLFENRHRLALHARVASGLGEGRYYLSQKGYVDQFRQKVGFAPFPGTLNLDLEGPETSKLRLLRANPALVIEGFRNEDRSFGAVDAWHAELRRVACVLILPHRTHHARTVELVAPESLRERLHLKDGDEVDVGVALA